MPSCDDGRVNRVGYRNRKMVLVHLGVSVEDTVNVNYISNSAIIRVGDWNEQQARWRYWHRGRFQKGLDTTQEPGLSAYGLFPAASGD